MSEATDSFNLATEACADRCPIERARFLRSTALAALAGIAGAQFLASSASAQSVGSIAPSRTQGKVLTYPLPTRDGASIDADNGVILARVKNAVYALSIICPHRAVTTLEWIPSAKVFHCPKHDAHFQADGELIDGRPDRAMDRFAIRRSGQAIAVDTSSTLQQDASQDLWSRAFVAVS
jgi:nitrite reductase/ring-hydroxylating ferredoxin subunit